MFHQPKIFAFLFLALGMTLQAGAQSERAEFAAKPGGEGQAIAVGPFKPDWNSLTNYHTPEWFRDAKFGIWAHYSCQCEPECGDWYARYMYQEGSPAYLSHLKTYGHPSTNGFKEIISQWKADDFDPDKLLAFYKNNGARYFVALAAHCDNFDNWNSKYQPWNSVNLGPHKDIIGGWAKAARKNGLRFGVSLHNGGWTWRWFEPAQGADTNGPLAGVPYDGRLTKSDGAGKWWDGLDPQDLYEQNHPIGAKPSDAYCMKYYLRAKQLWDDYQPDLVYFDESGLPMRYLEASDVYGLNLYAHFYNSSIRQHGDNEAVVTAKGLDTIERRAIVYDIERGKAAEILPQPWQTDTCLGDWHYSRELFERHGYKGAAEVVHMLVDVVSKNGNLLLSVPLQRGGQPDADELKIVSEIGDWLKVNGEAIYATRPWKVYGEGPSTRTTEQGPFGGQADFQKAPFTAADIRFTQAKDGKQIYALTLRVPDGPVKINSFARDIGKVTSVSMVGSRERMRWTQNDSGLEIQPAKKWPSQFAVSFRIRLEH